MTDEEFYHNLKIGMVVMDDLTRKPATILNIIALTGTHSWKGDWIYLDNNYLDGMRYIWEISPYCVDNGTFSEEETVETDEDGEMFV